MCVCVKWQPGRRRVSSVREADVADDEDDDDDYNKDDDCEGDDGLRMMMMMKRLMLVSLVGQILMCCVNSGLSRFT